MKNEVKAKTLICFWLSCVVFLSCVYSCESLVDPVFGSCFRTLTVILVSDFSFHKPPNSDMNHRIFNVRTLSFCMGIYTAELGLLLSHTKDAG